MSLGKKIRGGFAALLSASLILSGALLVAPAASAEEGPETPPVPATAIATVQAASAVGLTVQVAVSGVLPSTLPSPQNVGVYVSVVEAGSTAALATAAPIYNAAIVDGATAATLSVPASKLDRAKAYETLVWYAHGEVTTDSLVARADIMVNPDQWDLVFPAVVQDPEHEGGDDSSATGDSTLLDPQTPDFGVTVSKTVGVTDGESVEISGVLPAVIANGGVDKNTSIYTMWCVMPAEGQRASGTDCDSTKQKWLMHTSESRQPAVGSVVDGVWTFTTSMTVPSSFGDHECLADGAEQCGVFVRLGHSFTGEGSTQFDQFIPVTFAEPSEEGLTARIGTITPGEGLKIDVVASGLPSGIPFAYVAVFEKPAVAGSQLEMNAFTPVSDGSLSTSLEVPIASLDRTRSYEVVTWKQHSTLNEENLYQRVDLQVADSQWDDLFATPIKPAPIPQPAPAPAPASQSAGSLTWGISTSFARYVTGDVASGTITTSGVGGGRGGYVFPQASGGSWNAQTQTGSIPFSGVVTFTGHKGALSRTVSNPVITVTSATSATISVSGQPFGTLNLAAASKSVGANGEITWSGVPVSGGFGYGSYDLAADPLTFTVGAVSGATFGSTSVTAPVNIQRTAAPAPPATSGVRVITQSNELVAGGEIEFEASGFQPGERGILVVMYSEPTVLDTNAGADANGVVRWIGTLPDDLTGEHTITLQGSINVGKVITIAAAEQVKKTAFNTAEVEDAQIAEVQAAGVSDSDGPGWVIWASALALLVVAGGLTALVVSQRRNAGGGTL
ncbi:HtaA domain-containing protein [Leucobacter sp. W1038]|uniref:HtaA domain-containing protein n=1 Tax=Leucobacter sp. W1038 TaxID=3438281 RepID=UPI003D994CFC